MQKLKFYFALVILLFLLTDALAQTKFEYPKPKRSEQMDEYHGVKISDPFRGLENPDSPETRAWIDAENRLTNAYLATIPERETIKKRLTQLWNYEKYSAPFKVAGKYFYYKNDGLQNQFILYVADSPGEKGRVLIDPNTLSRDGTIALANIAISEDAKFLAYSLSSGGSDWQEWHVREVATGKDLSDLIKWSKFSGASWTKDGKGFFYSRYPEPSEKTKLEDANFYQKLYYHKIGTPQSEDVLVYERPDHKDWGFSGNVTEDGRYLIISVWKGSDPKNLVFFKDLNQADGKVIEIISEFESEYSFLGNDGAKLYFKTDKEAPRGRIISINANDKVSGRSTRDAQNVSEVLPQSAEAIDGVSLIGNTFIVSYLKDAYTQTRVFDMSGKFVREVKYPGIGAAGGFGGRRDDRETFYSFASFTTPMTIYRYDLASGKSELFRAPKVAFRSEDYEVKQVKYKSKDGTLVPMFIVHKKGVKLDSTNPTLLYGYGGFNVSMTPSFSISRLIWMEMGGVFAMPNLRGGGEYGEEWHQAGTKLKKQNVFDDFIAAAEWLIANKYTQPAKLAISGASNGGLLVGAVLNQRPELFGAALPAVGVMDMLRFHKFTIGWGWTSDYGSADNADEFKALYAYSPLHNIKKGAKYPAVLITTADHDDRVVPAHSFKYAATLQVAQGGDAPVLIRIETKAGHGAGKPTAKIIEEQADIYGFLVKTLGVKAIQN
jgi:prolyl oligopeptidase